jgi:phage/plasmid-associated DNA primase
VRGCQEWQEHRLAVPDAVRNPTAEYRAQSDPLRDWLVDRCRFDPEARTLSRALRDDHDRWCQRRGATAASNTEWGDGLRRRGVHKTKSSGHKAWRGIALLQEDR